MRLCNNLFKSKGLKESVLIVTPYGKLRACLDDRAVTVKSSTSEESGACFGWHCVREKQ